MAVLRRSTTLKTSTRAARTVRRQQSETSTAAEWMALSPRKDPKKEVGAWARCLMSWAITMPVRSQITGPTPRTLSSKTASSLPAHRGARPCTCFWFRDGPRRAHGRATPGAATTRANRTRRPKTRRPLTPSSPPHRRHRVTPGPTSPTCSTGSMSAGHITASTAASPAARTARPRVARLPPGIRCRTSRPSSKTVSWATSSQLPTSTRRPGTAPCPRLLGSYRTAPPVITLPLAHA
jgi:hypothetical protein